MTVYPAYCVEMPWGCMHDPLYIDNGLIKRYIGEISYMCSNSNSWKMTQRLPCVLKVSLKRGYPFLRPPPLDPFPDPCDIIDVIERACNST